MLLNEHFIKIDWHLWKNPCNLDDPDLQISESEEDVDASLQIIAASVNASLQQRKHPSMILNFIDSTNYNHHSKFAYVYIKIFFPEPKKM